MTKQLVFIHGRAQEHKDADALKQEWITSWEEGLAASGLVRPISKEQIHFPYYGQTLYDLVNGESIEDAAKVIVRGDNADAVERDYMRAVLQEVRQKAGIDDAMLAEVAGEDVVARGPLNWEWLQGILKALDRIPGVSGASIALATNDVYQYLENPGIRDEIESGVRQAIPKDAASVVVSHSLGTVVAYSLLRREAETQNWNVPLLVTLGSPLAVTEIKRRLTPIQRPGRVGGWFNAMDERDVVALYPLDPAHFAINPPKPPITNKLDVDNNTENHHGITGYLRDPVVAKTIHDALI